MLQMCWSFLQMFESMILTQSLFIAGGIHVDQNGAAFLRVLLSAARLGEILYRNTSKNLLHVHIL